MYSRGNRPLIFSTELARSPKEAKKHPHLLRDKLEELIAQRTQYEEDTEEYRTVQSQIDAQYRDIERGVAVFGAIQLRTDGRKVILAQKLEQARGLDDKWDIYCLTPDSTGNLVYQSKY
jgi:hypothetical protein